MNFRRQAGPLLVVLLVMVICARVAWVCDDAYITFRFARNLALGRGLVFNVGESPPVEGYSNFLWMILCAAFEWIGAPVELLIPALSALCGAVVLWRTFTLCRSLGTTEKGAFTACLPLACSPALAVWSTSGLATMPFTLLLLLLAERVLVREAPTDALAAGLASPPSSSAPRAGPGSWWWPCSPSGSTSPGWAGRGACVGCRAC